MLDLAGINPEELFTEEPQELPEVAGQVRAQRGGSIAAPPTPAAPAMAPAEMRV